MSCNEWEKVKLKNLTTEGRGFYGIGASAVEYDEDLLTYLRITDISDDGFIDRDNLMSVKDEKAKNYLLKKDDIVFARTGNSTGRSYLYEVEDNDLVYAGFLIKFNLDDNKVNPRFVKYYTISKNYWDWVEATSTGSTRKNINAKMYGDMEINLPSRKYQDLVVGIMDSITHKLLCNNKINKTLEEMAQAIYKHWFVDFEFPNENGEPYKSSGGKFVESELGMIPEGWKTGKLADLINVKYGKDHKKLDEGDIPVFGSGGVMRYVDTALYSKESVLIPRKGTLSNVIYINEPFWSVDTMFYTEMKTSNVAKFVYYFVSSKDLTSMNTGSAVPSMTTEILNKLDVVIPSQLVLNEFEKVISALFIKCNANSKENKSLTTIRDILLPKLMSGEIRIPDAEKEVEACLQKNS